MSREYIALFILIPLAVIFSWNQGMKVGAAYALRWLGKNKFLTDEALKKLHLSEQDFANAIDENPEQK